MVAGTSASSDAPMSFAFLSSAASFVLGGGGVNHNQKSVILWGKAKRGRLGCIIESAEKDDDGSPPS